MTTATIPWSYGGLSGGLNADSSANQERQIGNAC